MSITTVYAPTGYGKSTKWVAELQKANPLSRIVVVEPRVVNCLNIAGTMQKFYPDLVVGYKTGLAHEAERFTSFGEASINYITPDIALAMFRENTSMFDILVIDEAHDMGVASDQLFLLAERKNLPIYLVSATLPTWCLEVADNHIDLSTLWAPLNEGYKVDIHTNSSMRYKEVDLEGNTIVFVPSKKWIKSQYCHGVARDKDWISQFDGVHYLFGGSKETSQALEAMSKGTFPEKGQVIFTNNAMSTGVTIPNVKTVIDYGLAIKPRKWVITHNYRNGGVDFRFYGSYIPCEIDKLDLLQRAGRGGRTCNTSYYCAISPVDYVDTRDIEEFCNLAYTLKPNDYKRLKNFYIKTKMLDIEDIVKYEKTMSKKRKGVTPDIWCSHINTHLEKGAFSKISKTIDEIVKDMNKRYHPNEWWKLIKKGIRPDGWDCTNSSSDHFAELRIKSLQDFCKANNIVFNNIRY